jgi:hypothetical protein
MAWIETSPGYYQRPLGGAELLVVGAALTEPPVAREAIQIRALANFTAPDSTDRVTASFRKAWKVFRLLRSPDIATTCDQKNKSYKVPTAAELEEWLDGTFRVAPSGSTTESVIREHQTKIERLPICYIVPFSTSTSTTFHGSLILFISHWRTEAAGAFRIINQLFDYAADPLSVSDTESCITHAALSAHAPGYEVPLLTPALEDILVPNGTTSEQGKARLAKYFENYKANLPCISVPPLPCCPAQDLSSPPIDPANAAVLLHHNVYTPETTSTLVQACREHGISVTASIHAAYLETIYQLSPAENRKRNYACMMPAEVRKRLKRDGEEAKWREQGCWNAAQMLLLTLPADQGFLPNATSLRTQYGRAESEEWLRDEMRVMSAGVMNLLSEMDGFQAGEGLPWITSFGVLDGEVLQSHHGGEGQLEIDSVTVWGDSQGPGLVLGVWTFRGRLNLQVSWNGACHEGELVERVVMGVEDVLRRELGVGLVVEDRRRVEV